MLFTTSLKFSQLESYFILHLTAVFNHGLLILNIKIKIIQYSVNLHNKHA